MTCFSGMGIRITVACSLIAFFGTTMAASGTPKPASERIYAADYRISPEISEAGANVELSIEQSRGLLRELSMPLRDRAISNIAGDGKISLDNGRIRWLPPDKGGKLRWFATINHLRDESTYDAYVSDDWALFRAEDVIPPTATRTLKGSVSKTRMMFDLPAGWSAVSQYVKREDVHNVSNPDRRFDRPTGWIVLGKLGVRNETIAGVRIVVAAPTGHEVRRLDILAMLNWNLPDVLRLLPAFPKRLTVVSAGEPMWRGGLSAPRSFYLHADRPLISENGTSTMMHEIMHIGLSVDAVKGADWIIEGLAEYYGLEVMRRSGTLSEKRYLSARSTLSDWGKSAKSMCADSSAGAVTARAVGVLARLDDEIGRHSNGEYKLDDLVQRIANSRHHISVTLLRNISKDLTGSESRVLSDKSLNNCEN